MSKAPSPAMLHALVEQRRVRGIMRQIVNGNWREVLLGMQKTQHRFSQMRTNAGIVGDMLIKIDLVDLAIDWHATVFAGKPITITLPEGFELQADSINEIRHRVLWDAMLGEAIEALNTYGHQDILITSNEIDGVVIELVDGGTCFATGPARADGQPSQFDVRWIIERTDPRDDRRKLRYLRIQRHTAGLIEELAFKCDGTDVLQDETKLVPATLQEAIGEGKPVPMESRATGVPYPLVVRLVSKRRDGEAVPLVRENDIDLLDAFTAAVTRVFRIAEKHGDPKFRVPESMMDKSTGEVDAGQEAIVDPDKEYEAILVEWDLPGMLSLMNSVIKMVLVRAKMSQALLGYRPEGGVTTDTYEKMKFESGNTLAHAHKTALYCTSPLERVWYIASLLEARMPTKGHSVVPPSIKVHPQIPKDQSEVAKEQAELLEQGLISQRRACINVHGDDEGEQVYAEIQAEKKAEADLAATTFSKQLGQAMNPDQPATSELNAAATGGIAQ